MRYIMIIESDSNIREILAMYFDACTSLKYCATSDYKGSRQCLNKNGHPSLVLLDYCPGQDISNLIQLFNPKIVILMTTGFKDGERITSTYGLRGLLKKPFNLEELENILKEID